MTSDNGLSASAVETIAGFTAGIVSTLAVHPLDVVKTRLQVDRTTTSRAGNSFRVARDIARHEGGVRALYRGFTVNAVGNSISWALYFLWYDKFKSALATYHGHPSASSQSLLGPTDYFLASAGAGILTCCFTNPLWVIKTRMLSTAQHHPGAYPNMVYGLTSIIRTEGLRGLYRGLFPAIIGCSHGAVQFMALEQLKTWRSKSYAGTTSGGGAGGRRAFFSNADTLLMSAAAKVFAGSVTYPYQIVRTRLQTHDVDKTYRSAGDVVAQVWRKEGIGGFYKGLGPNLARIVPSTCVMFLVYENTRYYLSQG
ncbi:MAG: hypothetical protein M4579_003276 [Chaenotheca gracillima]|nr:MAG: hypothetical protein M4579_003276 [Chaenotheca gracillima]